MLHSASILFCHLWINTGIYQQTSKKTVFFIGLLRHLPAYIRQVQKEIIVHCEKTALF